LLFLNKGLINVICLTYVLNMIQNEVKK